MNWILESLHKVDNQIHRQNWANFNSVIVVYVY